MEYNIDGNYVVFESDKLSEFVFVYDMGSLIWHSSILTPTGTGVLIYPYFFVNLETQGVPGVLMWIAILSVAFVAMGFAFYGLDRISKKTKN